MTIAILPVLGELPEGFAALRAGAEAQGYRHLERLAADWGDGLQRFERPGEALLAAYVGGGLVGIGGLTWDPVEDGAMRLRRFFVAARRRREGIGKALATALLRAADPLPVNVNAASGSEAFWEALGFVRDARDGHTHRFAPTST